MKALREEDRLEGRRAGVERRELEDPLGIAEDLAVERHFPADEVVGLLVDPGLDLAEEPLDLVMQRRPGVEAEDRRHIGSDRSAAATLRKTTGDPRQRQHLVAGQVGVLQYQPCLDVSELDSSSSAPVFSSGRSSEPTR